MIIFVAPRNNGLIVQGIERKFPKLQIQVRVLVRLQKPAAKRAFVVSTGREVYPDIRSEA